MSNRLSQLPLEALVLSDVPIACRLSQLPLEVLRSSTPELTYAQLSQLPLEVLVQGITTAAQVSQLPLEVLLKSTPALEVSVTQALTELAAQQHPTAAVVTQLPLEIGHQQLASAITATQLLVEVARDRHSQPATLATVTQLLIEIIRRPSLEPLPPPNPDVAADCLEQSTRLVNLALSSLGITDAVTSLASEASRAAETARRHYATELESVLRAHPWKFATRYAILPLVAGAPGAPINGDWTYRYRLPADCLFVRRIVPPDGRQRQFDPTPVPFDTTEDPTGRLLSANAAVVEIEYTARIDCPARVRDPLFRRACTWRLAHCFAGPLTRDRAQVASTYALYLEQIALAQARDQSEQQPQSPSHVGEAEWMRGRQ